MQPDAINPLYTDPPFLTSTFGKFNFAAPMINAREEKVTLFLPLFENSTARTMGSFEKFQYME